MNDVRYADLFNFLSLSRTLIENVCKEWKAHITLSMLRAFNEYP